jgi:hypothetical protein
VFSNKHVIIALIVAPILAVLAWLAVGSMVGETPAPAEPGRAYPLVAASSCRWASGECEMKNQQVALTLRFSAAGHLLVTSTHPLQGLLVSIEDGTAPTTPEALMQDDETALRWSSQSNARLADTAQLRLVARIAGSQFFGETSTVFAGTAARHEMP